MATVMPDPALGVGADWGRQLFAASDELVLIHDEAGALLEANPAACRRLGYSREDLLHRNLRDIYVQEPGPTYLPRVSERTSLPRARAEGVYLTRDGRALPVEVRTTAVQFQQRPALLAIARDLSHQRQLEESLGKQGQLLQSILDSMDNAIVVADSQKSIFLFNRLAERLFGPGLLQGSFDLYQADRVTPLPEFPLGRCVRGESFDDLEVFVHHTEAPHGLCVSMTGRPLCERGGESKGGVLVCRDITQRQRAARRLQAQYEIARLLAADDGLVETVRRVLQLLCATLEVDVGLLWQADSAGEKLHLLAHWRQPGLALGDFIAQSQACTPALGEELPGQVWQARTAEAFAAANAPWTSSGRWAAARAAGLRHVQAFPVGSGSATTGVLVFWCREERESDDALRSMMQALGNQVGQFLEHHRVEKELRDSEALYQSLVQSLPQNIFRKDRDGRLTFTNQRYCASLRRPLHELLGKNDFDLFPHELATKYVSDDRHIMATGQILDTTERHHLPDGSTIYVHVVKTPVYDAQNRIIGVQGIFWDVTEQVHATEGLAHSERRYRQLTEATMDGIVVVDEKGGITLFNPAAERIFGYQSGEVLGGSAAQLVPDLFAPLDQEGMQNFLLRRQDDLRGTREFQARRKDGGLIPIEISLSVLSEADEGQHRAQIRLLAAIRDLTERNKMRAVLVQNEKMASIGLLTAGVAHEINNPLAFVANNLVVLERDSKAMLTLLELFESGRAILSRHAPELDARIDAFKEEVDLAYVVENLHRLLERTREGVDRVTRIVHSMRGLARKEAPHRQDTHLPDLIDSSLEILHGRFKQLGVVVEQQHDAEPIVSCVSTHMNQVVLNLLVNAFQAIEMSRRDDGCVRVRTERQAEELLLEIADNGCGIGPEHLTHLFDPFFTTKEVGEGTGLGLSFTHQIVTAHGGRVEVDSALGQGSCFRIYLPLRDRRDKV
jgi:two-component system, NtrC family, sensor kinase